VLCLVPLTPCATPANDKRARCAAIDDENGLAAKCRAESVQQTISENSKPIWQQLSACLDCGFLELRVPPTELSLKKNK
jgi:hypothetical protein